MSVYRQILIQAQQEQLSKQRALLQERSNIITEKERHLGELTQSLTEARLVESSLRVEITALQREIIAPFELRDLNVGNKKKKD